MAVDSVASFQARAAELGIPAVQIQKLAARDVDTHARFAFVSAYQPQSSDDRPLQQALQDLLGAPAGDLLPVYRRLFYESHTLAVQDLRARVDRREGQEPRKLAMPERLDRLKRLREALPGLTIDAQLEPSHNLVDRVMAMAEEQALTYVDLATCTSREAEIHHTKKAPAFEFTSDGLLKLGKKTAEPVADMTGELRVRR